MYTLSALFEVTPVPFHGGGMSSVMGGVGGLPRLPDDNAMPEVSAGWGDDGGVQNGDEGYDASYDAQDGGIPQQQP